MAKALAEASLAHANQLSRAAKEHSNVEADLDHKLAQAKLARKGCDLMVVNDVSDGKVFGKVGTDVTMVHQQGPGRRITGSKSQAAVAILDEVRALLATQ